MLLLSGGKSSLGAHRALERICLEMGTAITTLGRALAAIFIVAAAIATNEAYAATTADALDIIVIAIGSSLTGVGC